MDSPEPPCRRLRSLGRANLGAVLLLLVSSTLGWLFLVIADAVSDGNTPPIDDRIMDLLRRQDTAGEPVGPPWLVNVCRDLTALGSTSVLTIVTATSAGFLLLLRRFRSAAFVVTSIVGAMVLVHALKVAFDRARPELLIHGEVVVTRSFPSAHSMMAAVTYLTLGAILARSQPSRWLRSYVSTVAVFLTVVVGATRVYLGVHWPTDVLAGWAGGAAWAIGGLLISRLFPPAGTSLASANLPGQSRAKTSGPSPR